MAALVVTGPLLLERGFWSFGDMVFTPHQPWKPEWYGGDGGVPRAVPSDALVSLATYVVPGDVLQKLILLGLLGGAGWGVLRLLRDLPGVAAAAGCVVYQWNPYVLERLAIGHWALLCGYAALPWLVVGVLRLVAEGWRAWPWVFVPAAVAAWTSPTGGVLAALCALAVVLVHPHGRQADRWGATALVALAVNLPWLVPGLLSTSAAPVDTTGARAFAASADTPLGSFVSLLTLGGMWKESVVPPERASTALVVLALAVASVGLVGAARAARRPEPRLEVVGIAVAAVPAFAFALVTTTGPGQSFSAWLATTVPGGGIVRDSQKWLALLALLIALGVGHAAVGLVRAADARSRVRNVVLVVGVAVVQVMTVPSLAWGNLGRWPVSPYPREWAEVAAIVGDEPEALRQGTVTFPFEVYRRYGWNGRFAWLDPAPRILPGRVIADDALGLGGDVEVAGESAAARAIRAADGSWETLDPVLDELAVRYVLVQEDTPGDLPGGDPRDVGYELLHEGAALLLYDRGEQADDPALPSWRWALLIQDALLALAFLGAAGWCVLRHRQKRLGAAP